MNLRWIVSALFGLVIGGVSPLFARLPLEGRVIVLDPGHATKDDSGDVINTGASSRDRKTLEREIVLQVGAMMVPLLESQGARVIMTRTPENPWRYNARKAADNRARAIQANLWRADAYIRLHCDWNRSPRYKGFSTFYYRWGSRPLAKSIHEAMGRAIPSTRDNGIRRKSFVSATTRMPTVLVELSVLSNKEDLQNLVRGDFQLLLAQAITEGIVKGFE